MSNEIIITNESEKPDESPFAVHIRNDKKKKFYQQAATAHISVKEFFDFVKTAYQINESVDELIPQMLKDDQNSNENSNLTNLANSQLINQLMELENANKDQNEQTTQIETECQTDEKFNDNEEVFPINQESETYIKYYNQKLKQDEAQQQESRTELKTPTSNKIHAIMNETINEGLLDKVLPYITPHVPPVNQPVIKRQNNTADNKRQHGKHGGRLDKSSSNNTSIDISIGKSSSKTDVKQKHDGSSSKTSLSSTEPEVEIHVCDEVKHLKKDFRCPQQLLISKMGYFAEITAGQKLEDIDISVHCDIGIFDWLMRWTKRETFLPEDWPQLDATCVAPILVSAAFLQMDPLIDECLFFFHEHMNEILKTSTNLSCLNDMIISRLAAMYTNTELESIRDKKDKIISRLYCKLILSLGEPVPQSIRGHWASLAGIYRCCKCGKLVSSHESPDIPCIPSCMQVALNGNIVSEHVRDMNWNLSEYIVELYRELKTWRKVYWRLWSVCHFLRCVECLTLFPVHQMSWCCRHPEQPQFFVTEGQRSTAIPVGRYPCCGVKTYRFEVLTNTTQGCQFKEHIPDVKNPRDLAILSLFNHHRNVIEQPPPEIMIPERLTKLIARDACTDDNKLFQNNEVLWWEGIELAPPREKLGLLGKMCFVTKKELNSGAFQRSKSFSNVSSSEFSSSDSEYEDSESSSISQESGDSSSNILKFEKFKMRSRRKTRRKRSKENQNIGRHWSPTLSARSNQDIQRDFEENAMQQITDFLSRRTTGVDNYQQRIPVNNKQFSSIWNHHITPIAGVYQRLEAEWNENNRQTTGTVHSSKHQKSAVSYIVKPKFRVHRNDK